MRVLLEMRPAFDGHSGIPQETRLLFCGLAGMTGVQLTGLIQSSNLAIERGLPLKDGRINFDGLTAEERINRLSQVVVSLQQGQASHPLEHWRRRALKLLGPLGATMLSTLGRQIRMTGFDARHHQDFIWRSMFAQSLPAEDLERVTSRDFRVLRWPWSALNFIGVMTGYLGHAVYPRLDTRGIDVMLVETPYPGRVSDRTRMVVRYHDAIPLLMPHTIKDRGYHRAQHFRALQRNARDGAWFACVSEATRQDLLAVMPQLEPRAVMIPNMISHHFHPETESAARVPEIVWSRKNRSAPFNGGADPKHMEGQGEEWPYLLMVSTIEPRKNHLALIDAWELLRHGDFPRLNLVCVGGLGWDHQAILARFAPWLQRGGVHLLSNVPASDLRLLYRHAKVTVCPSLGEGFDFAGVEAMRCGGVVAASDIRVHRDVYGSAAEYFNPYSSRDMAEVLGRLMVTASESRRVALREQGAQVSARYLPGAVMPQWAEFLRKVVA